MSLSSPSSTVPNLVTLLPCGMVSPFNQALRQFLDSDPAAYQELIAEMEGNVNHENSYYPQLEKATQPSELPDILVASDINHLFHKPFRERFLSQDLFTEYLPHGKNAYLSQQGFFDPLGQFTMLSTNLLVMVVDLEQLGSRPMPGAWKDLLSPEFNKSIVVRGDGNFFCNGVLLPFYRFLGQEAIVQLARNVIGGMHPAEMAKQAGAGKPNSPAIYIMPFFFYDKIAHQSNVAMVWPSEGAIPSPVFLLAKRSALNTYSGLLDFLVSQAMGELFSGRGFPFCHPGTHAQLPGEKLFWVGWDFLHHSDVGSAKDSIQQTFRAAL